MTWAQWKKEFRSEVETHIYWYYLEFLKHKTIWNDKGCTRRPATENDVSFKEFIKKAPMSLPNGINSIVHKLGHKNYPRHCYDNNYLEFKVGPTKYTVYDNPFTLITIYKNANQRF